MGRPKKMTKEFRIILGVPTSVQIPPVQGARARETGTSEVPSSLKGRMTPDGRHSSRVG